ncbi:MAG: DinB family protein [Candidatus Bipolaricaulota bacterium]|nr:MAG: DinB family protein [Candidatus Bipolaricaulota bacterium]
MDAAQLIERLERGAPIVRALVEGVEGDLVLWRPEPGAWSVLEVIAHLLDEEREDFRVRLGLLLDDTEAEWPPIDPEGWVTARSYSSWNLEETLDAFLEERQASLAWLDSLGSPDWEQAKDHPLGPMTAGDLLGAWVAHDLLHARQLVRLHWMYVRSLAAPHRVSYAGEWTHEASPQA